MLPAAAAAAANRDHFFAAFVSRPEKRRDEYTADVTAEDIDQAGPRARRELTQRGAAGLEVAGRSHPHGIRVRNRDGATMRKTFSLGRLVRTGIERPRQQAGQRDRGEQRRPGKAPRQEQIAGTSHDYRETG